LLVIGVQVTYNLCAVIGADRRDTATVQVLLVHEVPLCCFKGLVKVDGIRDTIHFGVSVIQELLGRLIVIVKVTLILNDVGFLYIKVNEKVSSISI